MYVCMYLAILKSNPLSVSLEWVRYKGTLGRYGYGYRVRALGAGRGAGAGAGTGTRYECWARVGARVQVGVGCRV